MDLPRRLSGNKLLEFFTAKLGSLNNLVAKFPDLIQDYIIDYEKGFKFIYYTGQVSVMDQFEIKRSCIPGRFFSLDVFPYSIFEGTRVNYTKSYKYNEESGFLVDDWKIEMLKEGFNPELINKIMEYRHK